MSAMRLCFVIVSHRRSELLRLCLESLDVAGCPGAEVLVVLNGEDADSLRVLRSMAEGRPQIKTRVLARISRGAARNWAMAQVDADIVYFLDDDVTVPPGFCRRVLDKFGQYPGATCIGGPNLGALAASAFQEAVDFVLGSFWGAGPMRVRYRVTGGDRVLSSWGFILCNLGARRELFTEDGLSFPESCISAEENILLYRAQTRRRTALFSPELFVYHVRRASLAGFCRQVFESGSGRMQITRMEPASFPPICLLPLFLLAYLFSLSFVPWNAATLAPLLAYAAICGACSVRLWLKSRNFAAAAWLPMAMLSGHVSYGVGMLVGLCLPIKNLARLCAGPVRVSSATNGNT